MASHEALILDALSRQAEALRELTGTTATCAANIGNLQREVSDLRNEVNALRDVPQSKPGTSRSAPARDAAMASAGGTLGIILWNAGAALLSHLSS